MSYILLHTSYIGARLGLDLEHSQFPRPVKVLGVAGGSHGEKAGLKFDDHILSVNDVRTWNMDQCVKLIADGVAKGPIKLQACSRVRARARARAGAGARARARAKVSVMG